MPTRSRSSRGSSSRVARVTSAAFAWDPSVLACLHHPTLPSLDAQEIEKGVEVTPLEEVAHCGGREALSITGQYATHAAFLRRAGVQDGHFDPEDWGVVRKKDLDCRLVRLRAAAGQHSDPPPATTLIERVAKFVASESLPVFTQPWAKADIAFCEAERALRKDRRHDRSALLRAAVGSIRSPGIEAITVLLNEDSRINWRDPIALQTTALAASLGGCAFVLIGDAASSPLLRYSGIAKLLGDSIPDETLHPGDLSERILSRFSGQRLILAIESEERLDRVSSTVLLTLLSSATGVSWLVPEDSASGVTSHPGEATRFWIVSQRLSAGQRLAERVESVPAGDREEWLVRSAEQGQLSRFWDEGALPDLRSSHGALALPEPRRSYLAALTLLGSSFSRSAAEDYLRELRCHLALDEIMGDLIDSPSDPIVPRNPELWHQCRASLPEASRASLSLLAAEALQRAGCDEDAARLFADAGKPELAVACLERILASKEATSAEETAALLERFPHALIQLSAGLARAGAHAAIACGRFAEAESLASILSPAERALIHARIERRRGHYAGALISLADAPPGIERLLLEAELLRLVGRRSEAAERLTLRASEDPDVLTLEAWCYASSVLAVETAKVPEPSWIRHLGDYFRHRYEAYRAHEAGDLDRALEESRAALEAARDPSERIDAAVDIVFTQFLSGSWEPARHEARLALALVEETEGDRAAGGILFTLAYLCADDGQWDQARRIIERLRTFYASTADDRRLGEIHLLDAQLALGEGRWRDARRSAQAVIAGGATGPIGDAAHLVMDEVDWLAGAHGPLRSSGTSACAEFRDRARHMMARRGLVPAAEIIDPFGRALALWEEQGEAVIPSASSVSQRLRLLRSALFKSRMLNDAGARELAISLQRETGIQVESLEALDSVSSSHPPEALLMAALATRPFPFQVSDLPGVDWCCAERNRLERWTQSGSIATLSDGELEQRHVAAARDWRRLSDDVLLFVEGIDGWPVASAHAFESLFRIRLEHSRMSRALAPIELESPRDIANDVDGILGDSPAMRDLRTLIRKVAARDLPVLVTGETGTGKELVARGLHRLSSRRQRVFTPVNCASLPENLIESELFGHVRGAFTGADRDKAGLIEVTDGGTLLLDEIGELPLTAQAKLLRFLQESEFRRVGDTVNRSSDVRIVAATHRRLEESVDEGRFREDLYYRIRVIEIRVPPLRERGRDILQLARHFLQAESERHGTGAERFSEEAELMISSYAWPGNVRELQNEVRAAHMMAADSRTVDLEHIHERVRSKGEARAVAGSYFDEIAKFRRGMIERSLDEAAGNQNRAAKLLGITRQALAYQIRELGIRVKT